MKLSLLQLVITVIGCTVCTVRVGVGTTLSSQSLPPSPSPSLSPSPLMDAGSGTEMMLRPRTSLGVSLSTMEQLMVSPTPTPVPAGLIPVFEDPVVTYGENKCEKFVAEGHCERVLSVFPGIVSNYSRMGNQYAAKAMADQFIEALISFDASEICLEFAVPLVCRWTIPTCDPAFVVPTYQPLCRYDCEIIRDFVCKRPWEEMLQLLHLLNIPDQPDCSPLSNTEAGNAPMCVGTIRTGAVPLPQRTGTECYSGTGRGYSGTINETRSGIPCQGWNSSYPHQHLLYLEGFDELEGGHNYCRNPGNRGMAPWCFTTDREVRWEYCDIPICERGGVCEPFNLNATYGVCRTNATIGMDLIFVNKSIAEQSQYDEAMHKLEMAAREYSENCRDIYLEYVCVTNFPQCDLSHPSPRPHLPCRDFCELVLSRCEEDLSALRAFGGLVGLHPLRIEFDCNTLPEANGGDTPECFLPVTMPPEMGMSAAAGVPIAVIITVPTILLVLILIATSIIVIIVIKIRKKEVEDLIYYSEVGPPPLQMRMEKNTSHQQGLQTFQVLNVGDHGQNPAAHIATALVDENSLKTKQATTTSENPAYGGTKVSVTTSENTAYQAMANELDVTLTENTAYGATDVAVTTSENPAYGATDVAVTTSENPAYGATEVAVTTSENLAYMHYQLH